MLFSRSNKIKDLVGHHTSSVIECYDKFAEAINDILDGCSDQQIENYTNSLRHLESQSDEIRRQIIRELLEGGLVMDSRKSIMHVIEAVDEVADLVEDIVQEIYIQGITLPDFTHENIRIMVKVTREQLGLLVEIVNSIVDRYSVDEVAEAIARIEQIESEVDDLQQSAVKHLFRSDFSLAQKMQLREIINLMAKMADLIEDISDEVEIIMLARKV